MNRAYPSLNHRHGLNELLLADSIVISSIDSSECLIVLKELSQVVEEYFELIFLDVIRSVIRPRAACAFCGLEGSHNYGLAAKNALKL